MPFVDIKLIKGRSLEQKRQLVAAVTEAVANAIDVPAEKIWVHLNEMAADGFATGGQLVADRKK